MTSVPPAAVSVAVVDDELVRLGVESMLAPFDWIELLPLAPGQSPPRHVDLLLCDSCAPPDGVGPGLEAYTRDPRVGAVVLFTWSLTETVVASAKKRGVHAALPKSLDAEQLARALWLVHSGGGARVSGSSRGPDGTDDPEGGWPGRLIGLTPRESEVISLVTSGLSNGEIALETHLSINSVKSYIRSAYRSMGVSTRSQAVLWGIDNGMAPTRMSLLLPPAS